MTELTIALPLVIVLLSAVVDFGLYLHDYVALEGALRAGAAAAIQLDENDGSTFTDDEIRNIIQLSKGLMNPVASGEIRISRRVRHRFLLPDQIWVEIEVIHPHVFLFPLFLPNGRNSLNISSRIEALQVPGLS